MNYIQYKNKLKLNTCLKHHESLLLIKALGHGIMSKSHFYEHYYRLYNFSENTCRRILQDLLQSDLVEIIHYQGVHIVKLKKFAIRFLKEQELRHTLENHQVSSTKVTNAKIKRILFINQFALSIIKETATNSCENMPAYIKLFKAFTPFFYSRSESLPYYRNVSVFLKNDMFDVYTPFYNELNRLEHNRLVQAQSLINQRDNNLSNTTIIPSQTSYDLNNMLNSNIFLLIKQTGITIAIGDPFKIYTAYNIAPLLLKINTYLYNLFETDAYIPFPVTFTFIATSPMHQANLQSYIDYAYTKIREDSSNIYSFPYQRENFKVILI